MIHEKSHINSHALIKFNIFLTVTNSFKNEKIIYYIQILLISKGDLMIKTIENRKKNFRRNKKDLMHLKTNGNISKKQCFHLLLLKRKFTFKRNCCIKYKFYLENL